MAEALGQGKLSGTYADGAIILCAAIGAMSSLLWKRELSTDKKRFVESVVRFRQGGPDTTRVSAPLMAAAFPQFAGGLGVRESPNYQLGKTEEEVHALCAAGKKPKAKAKIRRYSYANLLYEQVRCSFIHEYRPGLSATESDPVRTYALVGDDEVSYVNPCLGSLPASGRTIHFTLKWIASVLLAVATGIDDECYRRAKSSFENLGCAAPHSWWVDGG